MKMFQQIKSTYSSLGLPNQRIKQEINFETKARTLIYFWFEFILIANYFLFPQLFSPFFPFDIFRSSEYFNKYVVTVLKYICLHIDGVIALNMLFIILQWSFIEKSQISMMNMKIIDFLKKCKSSVYLIDNCQYQEFVSRHLLEIIRIQSTIQE